MQTTALTKTPETSEKAIEFTPFGAADKIKLSLAIVKNFVAVKTKTGQTCDDRDAMRFIMLCQAQRLNPFAGDAFLTGYDTKDGARFSLITAHVAFLKRAESCPDYEGMESGVILTTEDGSIVEREGDFYLPAENVVGGWARVHRKGRKPTYRRLAIEQRKPAYQTPFWDPPKHAEQIVKCAEADALRATFPSLLGGLHIQPETLGETINITSEPPARDPKRLFSAKPEALPAPTPDAPRSIQDELAAQLEGVPFDAFGGWLVTRTLATENDVSSWSGFSDVPAKLAETLLGDPKTLAACVKLYRK